MAESDHPIPNLPALRAQLGDGLALELIDALDDVDSMAEISPVLTELLRTRVLEIEERQSATPEVA